MIGLLPKPRASKSLQANFAFLSLSVLLVPCLFLTSGCHKSVEKEALSVAQRGSRVYDDLAKYYQRLADERRDYAALFAFQLKRLKSVPNQAVMAEFQEQEDDLDARADAASKMKSFYDSLGDLINYGAQSEVTNAASDLRSAIEKVNNHPFPLSGLPAAVNPGTWLDKGFGALAQAQQQRDIRRNLDKILAAQDGFTDLFAAEKTLYVQVDTDYESETGRLALFLLENKQATLDPNVFQKFLTPYLLQPSAAVVDNADVREWYHDQIGIIQLARVRAVRSAADNQMNGLIDLGNSETDLLHKPRHVAGRPPTGTP